MNKKFYVIKRAAALAAAAVMAFAAACPSAVFADDSDDARLVYRSVDAWPQDDELTADKLKNDDAVWRFMYRDDQSNGEYRDYTVAAVGGDNSAGYVKPSLNDDGTYNYLAEGGSDIVMYTDSARNPGMRNAMGKYWMRPSVAGGSSPKQSTVNRIVKVFTAPRGGNVSVLAQDMSGNSMLYNKGLAADKTKGAVVRVKKISADGTETELWHDEFAYNGSSLASIKFGSIDAAVDAGDRLWFEVSAENGGSSWAKQVFWNPVVVYNYEPESIEPSDRTSVPLDTVFTVRFADEMEPLTADCISISGDGNPIVKDFVQSDDRMSISFAFDGLSGDSEYSVVINGIKLANDENAAELTSVFSFVTEHIFEYPKYAADDAWRDNSNADSVWRWLYCDNATKSNADPYEEYKIFGTGNTDGLAKPVKSADGSYDYAAATTDKIGVFADSNANHGMRNALGRYWARPSVATGSEPKQSADNRIVKRFTAPESGRVVISAADLNGESKIYNKGLATDGNKLNGAVVRIVKKNKNGADEKLFEHDFAYTESTCPDDGLAVLDFEDIECDISSGDTLWFEISAETGGSAYCKQVSWNPAVRYEAIYPNITECEPEDGAEGVAPNFVHKIRFDREVTDITAGDVEIDGARCSDVWFEDGNTLLCLKYDGLEANKKYMVKINNIRMSGTHDGLYRPYELSFATGDMVQFGAIVTDGALKSGDNTVRIDINNAAGSKNPYSAALLAMVCQKTENGYAAVSTRAVYNDKIGENDSLAVTVQLPNTDDYVIKAVLLETVPSARAITPIAVFSK